MAVTITWLATESTRELLGGDSVDAYYEQIILDGTVSEQYEGEATATEHPVEDDADITDHVKAALRRISLEVAVSAHPGPSSPAQADLAEYDSPAQRPATVRETLDRLMREGIEIDIETAVGVWESMLLLGISEVRNAEHGDGFRATLHAREFRRVSTREVEAPSPRVERGRRRADRGRQRGDGEDGTASSSAGDRSDALDLLQRFDPATWGDPR